MNRCTRVIAVTCVVVLMAAPVGPAQAAVDLGPSQLVSAAADGSQGNDYSHAPVVSADGRYVAFASFATNLVSGDTNGQVDLFVKDTLDGRVERVSVDERGQQMAWPPPPHFTSMSANGRYVVFETYEPERRLRLTDRTTGTSRIVQVTDRNGDPVSFGSLPVPQLSGNGRYLAFRTKSRLVRGDRDEFSDVYRLDLSTGAVRHVSNGPIHAARRSDSRTFSISHGGQKVAFVAEEGRAGRGPRYDVYVRDLRQRRPRLVSVSSSERRGNRWSRRPSLSTNGRFVAFTSGATNLVRRDTNLRNDVFVRDLRAGTTKRVSVNSRERQANHHSGYDEPSISADGRFVVFNSVATNLAPGTTDFRDVDGGRTEANIFVRDRRAGTTTAITMAPDGTGANYISRDGRISPDGSTVVFFSHASNLVEGVNRNNVYRRRLDSTRD